MFNAIRMDVYRLFKTKSTYIILVIMLAMSVMGTGIRISGSASRLPIARLYSLQMLSSASGVSKGARGVNSVSVCPSG